MTEKEIGYIGDGGQSREARSYTGDNIRTGFHALDTKYVDVNNGMLLDINEVSEDQENTPVIAAIGAPGLKKEMIEKWPGKNFETIISEEAYIDKSVEIGKGSIVAPRAVITTDVIIGEHVLVNIASSISHDSVIGNYVTIGPGAHIAGGVRLEDGVYVGIGAIISNNVSVAEGAVIGAGAVVVKDIKEKYAVVVGTPAKTIRINSGWLREI